MPETPPAPAGRRAFLAALAGVAAAAVPCRSLLASPARDLRELDLLHTHTGETLALAYFAGGGYLPDRLARVDRFLRDFRTGEVHPIDPALLDLLTAVRRRLDTDRPFHVISGYRSPATNAMLRRTRGGQATRSLHLVGKAIDVRLPGVPLAALRDAGHALRLGGVGYYPRSDFVHFDTGRVRRW